MFAFALWDGFERRLHLVRDRIGIKPLYYGHVDGSFVSPPNSRPLRFFRDSRQNRSRLSRGLHALRVRACAVLDLQGNSSAFPRPHFDVELRRCIACPCRILVGGRCGARWRGIRAQGSDEEIIEQLHEKLADAVRLRMIADVPLGAFLSGGIDSSTVVALDAVAELAVRSRLLPLVSMKTNTMKPLMPVKSLNIWGPNTPNSL